MLDKYKEAVPLTELIEAMHIGRSELMSFKIAVNEAIDTYGLTPSAAALHVISVMKDYNKKGQLQKELSTLYLRKYVLVQACARQSQALIGLAKEQDQGF